MKGELSRFAYLRSYTLGWLIFGSLRLATIERPWIPNPQGPGGMPKLSCVPDGKYQLQPWSSQAFPQTYILVNNALGVYLQPALIPPGQDWGRSAILIHIGNRVQDVIGCIAVGLRHSLDAPFVEESRAGMERLRSVLGRDNHELTVRPSAGTAEAA